jgi:hypothetical protein
MTNPSKKGTTIHRKWWIAFLILVLAVMAACFVVFKEKFPGGQSNDNSSQAQSADQSGTTLIDLRFDNPSALKGWREYSFNKKSIYKIGPDPKGQMVLHATSRDSYSSMFKFMSISLDEKPILRFEWRPDKFPTGKARKSFDASGENDFAIRVCAIFASTNPFVTDIIQYIWDDYYPVGTHAPSPYSKNVRMLVIESGRPAKGVEWASEKRDLDKDYETLFGKKRFRHLKAIAITTNADDTHTEAGAYIKRIWVDRSAAASSRPKKWFGLPVDLRAGIDKALKPLGILKRLKFWEKKNSNNTSVEQQATSPDE